MKSQRLIFLDTIRGMLLLIMIIYHYFFNLAYFFNCPINLKAFPLNIIPPLFSALFLFVSGFSSNLSNNSVKRGFYVLFWAMIITLVTFFVAPEAPIYFGILHCIGVMMVLKEILLKNLSNQQLIIIAVFLLFFAFISSNYYPNHNYFLFLGLRSRSFASLDFYPLIPHGAYFVLGLVFGKNFRPSFLTRKPKNKIGEVISLAGKNSLKVYLLHQPLFFLIYLIITLL